MGEGGVWALPGEREKGWGGGGVGGPGPLGGRGAGCLGRQELSCVCKGPGAWSRWQVRGSLAPSTALFVFYGTIGSFSF